MTSLPDWNFIHPIEVRFRDIDMFDHVNNAAYLTYVESARVAYYSHISGLTDPHAFDITVARIEIDFLKPIFFPAAIHVYTRASRIGTKSWTLDHQLHDASTSDLLARVSTILVHFDHHSGISKPIPSAIIEQIEKHEGRNLRNQS